MPFQKGHKINENRVNNPDGRKSSYEEKQDAEWHDYVWHSEQDIDALEKKVMSRKYAGRDIAALRLLKGDKTIIAKFMDKLVPSKVDITTNGKELPTPILGFLEEKQNVQSNNSD